MKIQPLGKIISGYLSAAKNNSNVDKIEAAFQNTISRDGSTPNDMGANLDLGNHRVINVGAPVSPNDAVRLQDITDIASGDLTISQSWNDLTDKPSTFPPSTHNHVAADITDFGEAVEDKIGAKVVAGPNISVSYNDTTGETTITASGSVSTAWADITGKPSTFTPSAHTHVAAEVTDLQEAVEDFIGGAITAGTNITVSYNDGTGKTTINSSGGGGGGFPTLEDFGGVGDGVTDNITAIAAAEASTSKRVYLNGTYKTSGSISALQYDKFFGPGKFLFGTVYRPASYHSILSQPTKGTGSGLAYFFSGDTAKVDMAHWRMGASGNNFRKDLSAVYFEPTLYPRFNVVQNWLGYSGTTAFTTNSITTGATTVNLDLGASGGDDLPNGTQFVFSAMQDGTPVHTATSLGVSGSTLSFTPAVPAATTIPAGYVVYVGKRTHHALEYIEYTATGGGDHYGWVVAISNEYQPTKGQRHVFHTSTIGGIGGSLTAIYDGTFMTGTEWAHSDTGHDAACVGSVLNFDRTNDTGARGAFWSGILIKSEGTKAMNSGIGMIGKFKVGLDLVTGTDFGTNRGAIVMKLGDRMHFNNTTTPLTDYSVNGDTYPASPMYIGSDTVSGVKVIELYNGIYRLRLQENGGLTTNASFTSGGNITAGGEVSGSIVRANGSGGVYRVYFGPDHYIENNGTNIRLVKNGVQVDSW